MVPTMRTISLHRSTRWTASITPISPISLVTAALGALLLATLVACGGEPDAAASTGTSGAGAADAADTADAAADPASDGAEGTVEIGPLSATFVARVCTADGSDILVSGPGSAADGTPVYVDLDATGPTDGEIRVKVGTDEPFTTGDQELVASNYVGAFDLTLDGATVAVEGEFTDDAGFTQTGTMEVSCS